MRLIGLAVAVAMGAAPGPATFEVRAQPVTTQARPAHSAEEAIGIVDGVAAMLLARGRAETFAAVSDPHGRFRSGTLYAYLLDAMDGQLTMLAHGANPALVGVPQRDIVDADGKAFNDETLALVQNGGTGWATYRWPNPETHKIGVKSSYVRMVEGVIIGVGIYQ